MPHSSVSAISGDCRVRNLRALLIPGADSGRPAAEPLRGPRGYHGCARVGAGARYRVLLPFWALPAPRGPLPHPRHTIPPPLKQMRTQAPTKESKCTRAFPSSNWRQSVPGSGKAGAFTVWPEPAWSPLGLAGRIKNLSFGEALTLCRIRTLYSASSLACPSSRFKPKSNRCKQWNHWLL